METIAQEVHLKEDAKLEQFANINSVVHIRQNAELYDKVTPDSSLWSSDYSKFNRANSSSFTTEQSNYDSCSPHYTTFGSKDFNFDHQATNYENPKDSKTMHQMFDSIICMLLLSKFNYEKFSHHIKFPA